MNNFYQALVKCAAAGKRLCMCGTLLGPQAVDAP